MRRARISKVSQFRRLPRDDIDELGLNPKLFGQLSRIYHSSTAAQWTTWGKSWADQLPVYCNEPLGPDEIRLVDFGAKPGEPVVIHASLGKDVPKYVALSYCWGQDNCLHQFVLNGQRLIVPSSLFLIFQSLQSRGFRNRFWADAICINQYDSNEKAAQIPLMGRIYSGADIVLGWIGEPTRMYPDFVDDLNDLHRTLEGHEPQVPTTREVQAWELGWAGPDHRVWFVLSDLMRSSWFRRVWILQEVMLATEVWVTYGPLQCRLGHISKLAWYLSKWSTNAIDRHLRLPGTAVPAWEAVRTLGLARQQFKYERVPAVNALNYAKYREVTKLEDKIYALYNILNHRGLLTVDLSAPAATVFARAAALAIGHEHDVSLLNSVNSKPSLPGLPSWAPDFSSGMPRINPLERFGFSAGYTSKEWPAPEVSADNTTLSIHGTAIDRVQSTVLPKIGFWRSSPETTKIEAHRTACSFFDECLRTIRASTSMHSEDALEALGRILMHDRPHQRRHLEARFENADLASWKKAVGMHRRAAAGDDWHFADSDYINESFSDAMHLRGFFVTKSGRLGIGPHWMQEGDTVLLLFGGSTPYLAQKRPAGDMYEFIGEAYVDGIMYGEAMREFEESGRPSDMFQFD